MPAQDTGLVGRRAAALPASATASLDASIKDLAAAGHDVINLTSGEVDFDTMPQASAAGIAAIESGFTRYTAAAGTAQLRLAVSDWLAERHGTRYGADQIVVANGAKHALFNAFTALLDPGDEVLLPAPYWVSFPHLITLAGGCPVVVRGRPENGFKITPGDLGAHLTGSTKVLVLNNPVNPTGAVYRKDELEALADRAAGANLRIISDEIYAELVYPPATFASLASISQDAMSRTVTINGVSKTFAMTGWRIGYAAAPLPVARAMAAIQSHAASAPSAISQQAALAALTSEEVIAELDRRRASLDRRRQILLAGLRGVPGIDVQSEPAGAFFVLAGVEGSYGPRGDGTVIGSAAEYARCLLERELVGVVPGESFGAPGYVRISYVADETRLRDAIGRLRRFASAPVTPG
jgi:aspartate aminotransferase